ncbi:MAG TPA: hypothetical protein VK942_17195, partial [Actinomycetes bacterium]|nr:hypothetical protein [Actinomycetes bacterium]
MSVRDVPPDEPSPLDGSRTAGEGTPFAVDVSGDRRARWALFMFVSGPVIWSVHFLVVYLVTEAGCSGDGPGLTLFDPPVPKAVTLAATAAAAAAALGCATWWYRRWRASEHEPVADEAADLAGGLTDRDRGGTLVFAGFLLSLLSVVTVLFVGLPAMVL